MRHATPSEKGSLWTIRLRKARFILNWRARVGGQQEATAHLELQGFRDPGASPRRLEIKLADILPAGEADIAHTIAATEDLPIAVADVRTAFL